MAKAIPDKSKKRFVEALDELEGAVSGLTDSQLRSLSDGQTANLLTDCPAEKKSKWAPRAKRLMLEKRAQLKRNQQVEAFVAALRKQYPNLYIDETCDVRGHCVTIHWEPRQRSAGVEEEVPDGPKS